MGIVYSFAQQRVSKTTGITNKQNIIMTWFCQIIAIGQGMSFYV
jgi:hypothetical protein